MHVVRESSYWVYEGKMKQSPVPRNGMGVGREGGGKKGTKGVAGARPEGLRQALEFLFCMTGSRGEPHHQIGLGLPACVKITWHQGGWET